MKTLNLFSVSVSAILALNMGIVIAEDIPITAQDQKQIQMSSENLQRLQGQIDQGSQSGKGSGSSHYGQGYESRGNGQGSNGGGGKGKQGGGKH